VSQLAEAIGVPMVNLSHHLGVMRQAGLLEDEKDGRRVVYRFRADVFERSNGTESLGVLRIGPFQILIHGDSAPASSAPNAKARRKPGGKS
jgi:DNA-binding transcriptional ArsR family regulator